jgi:XXXCH domain-containing protein
MAEIKEIKRGIAAAFNAVKKTLKAGQVPDKEACQALILAARNMAQALDRAQEEAAVFIALAEEVAAAAAKGDLEAATLAHAKMKEMRGTCHHKYK